LLIVKVKAATGDIVRRPILLACVVLASRSFKIPIECAIAELRANYHDQQSANFAIRIYEAVVGTAKKNQKGKWA